MSASLLGLHLVADAGDADRLQSDQQLIQVLADAPAATRVNNQAIQRR